MASNRLGLILAFMGRYPYGLERANMGRRGWNGRYLRGLACAMRRMPLNRLGLILAGI